jgi:hypothetical protein
MAIERRVPEKRGAVALGRVRCTALDLREPVCDLSGNPERRDDSNCHATIPVKMASWHSTHNVLGIRGSSTVRRTTIHRKTNSG